MMTTTPYETLVESAARLTGVDALDDIDDLHVSAASGLLQQNQLALESARRALGPECVVPLRYEEAFFPQHCDHVSHLGIETGISQLGTKINQVTSCPRN